MITRDPDTGARNVGCYRMQVIDERTTFMHWQLHKTGARHWRRYVELKRRMPVAVAIGGDPAYAFAATAPLPDGLDEQAVLAAYHLRFRPAMKAGQPIAFWQLVEVAFNLGSDR